MLKQILRSSIPDGPSDATSVVKAENLSFSWPGRWIGSSVPLFRNVSLEIFPGEIVGLTAPSGKGKSTLGDILLGLRAPTRGRIYWKGQQINTPSDKIPRDIRCRFQKIFQDPVASFPPGQTLRTAFEDVIRYHGIPGELEQLMARPLETLGLAFDMIGRFPHQLSGGEMQRMALARAMLVKPCFMVADEPTSRLDLSVQALIVRMIAEYARSDKCAVLLVSHDEDLIQAICDRAICL